MSTHCQPPAFFERKGTRGTPTGIMRVTCRRGPPHRLQILNFYIILKGREGMAISFYLHLQWSGKAQRVLCQKIGTHAQGVVSLHTSTSPISTASS